MSALVLLAASAGAARAEDGRRAGSVRLEAGAGHGGRGPIELQARDGAFTGELVIANEGKEPLVVSRIAVRGDAADPRTPPKLIVKPDGGVLPFTIAPGASKKAIVQWAPERGVRLRQLFGHVVVTTSDESAGEVAMGVHAQVPGLLGPLEAHVLSLLVGVPVLGALIVLLLRAFGRSDDRTTSQVTTVALVVQTLLALYVYRGFAGDVSRLDGNDGLQFIEHAVWIRPLAAEIFLGVDGIAAIALLVTSLVALFGLLFDRRGPRGAPGYHAAYLALAASAAGAICAMDGLLFVIFTAVAVVSATVLASGRLGARHSHAALRFGVLGLVAVFALLVAIVAVSRHADATFLVDGTRTATSFSLPELSRVALGSKQATLFGGALVKVAFGFVLLASIVLLGAFPLHGWLAPVLTTAPRAAGALVSAAMPAIGICALLRLGCAVLPEGMRSASGIVVALGAVTSAYGAFAALAQTDLRRLAAYASMTQIGFVLLGAGSMTPQGLSGAIVATEGRAVSMALFLLVVAAVDDRAHTDDVTVLEGVGRTMPGLSAVIAVAALGQAGVMGFGGAWGPLLALLGALPNYGPLALVSVVALLVLAVAHLRVVSRLVFGRLDPSWEKSPLLEAFGGRFPDLTGREWMAMAPLAVLVVLLGLWPAPLLGVTTGTVRDIANAVSPPGAEQIATFLSSLIRRV
ncbi:NADH-ubiquinone oxidoreductase chain M [Labilithrix luteola]|uniref:NADH-ubiquinone oxidoreductase chain M n=1 Tax=Labilithrix luteola TaxID=1391654 RepID=A0A0K1PLW6_9BACT|nr:NADH-ubiquinone oxidoreductase chain M [Labilithrix luteola]